MRPSPCLSADFTGLCTIYSSCLMLLDCEHIQHTVYIDTHNDWRPARPEFLYDYLSLFMLRFIGNHHIF